MNFKQAAIAVLKAAEKPLHNEEITKLAMERGLLETEGLTPEMTMAAQIAMDIKRWGKKSYFIRKGPNTFDLNPERIAQLPSHKVIEEEIIEQEEEEVRLKLESSYVGRAGEYLVCSELLFRGFNASTMSVDEGIDIAAVKDNALVGIQVKTAHENKFGEYHYNMRKKSFLKNKANNIYYIFVLKNKIGARFVVLPFFEMQKKIREGAIREIRKGTAYRIMLRSTKGKIFLGTNAFDISYFLNNWGIIS